MAKLFTFTFFILLVIFCSVSCQIITNSDGNGVAGNKPQKHVKPNKKTGEKVANWTKDSDVNPEELGDYAEGDIMYPDTVTKTTGLISPTKRWPNAVVPYVITGTFTTTELNLITNAMKNITSRTCVKFVPKTTEVDFVNIGNANTGCWSYLGRIGGGQPLNLQSPGCVTLVGTAIHELLHALGFVHEHTRPNRDNFVTILFQNIIAGQESNFDKYSTASVNSFGLTYDYGSVMHYSAYTFSSNGQPTIQTKTAMKIGQRTGLSAKDVSSIKLMYGCPA